MSISPLSFNVAVLCQMFDLTCLTMEDPPANKTWDCKDIDNYHCGSLDQVFQVGPMTAPRPTWPVFVLSPCFSV